MHATKVSCNVVLLEIPIRSMGSGAGGQGPPDLGKNMDLFDFPIMNLTFFRFRPPPQILGSSGPHDREYAN